MFPVLLSFRVITPRPLEALCGNKEALFDAFLNPTSSFLPGPIYAVPT